MYLSQYNLSDASEFLLAFTRIGAMVLTLPKLMSTSYFLLYRLLFSLVLALVITPLISAKSSGLEFGSFLDAVSLVIAEMGVGLCLGLAASCVVIGLSAAGQVVSQLLGFQIGSLQQGLNAEQNSDYRKLFFIAGLCCWFAISGHRFAIQGLLQSFTYLPLGEAHFSNELMQLLNQLIHSTLEFAIRFTLPILIVSLFGFLVAGFFSSILGMGQSTNIAFGVNQLLFFMIGIPLLAIYSEEVTHEATGHVERLITTFMDQHAQVETK